MMFSIPSTVLGLAHYPSVMELLQPRVKREVATKIVQVGLTRESLLLMCKLC